MKTVTLLFLLSIWVTPTHADSKNFPAGFQWCVSTAAHQVEGDNVNSDFWAWEQTPGHIRNGDKSGLACDEWNRFDEDISLIRDLGGTRYRFSVEWAKIEPVRGQFNADALAHYRAEVDSLKAAGIDPFVTLHHFTAPTWFTNSGGWERDDAPTLFADFVSHVADALLPEVHNFVTLNEPMVLLLAGWGNATFPPGKADAPSLARALRGMVRGHALAYAVLHAKATALGTSVRVGVAHHLRVFEPEQPWNPLDLFAANLAESRFNWTIPDALRTGHLKFSIPFEKNSKVDEVIPGLAGTEDFVGLNYYTRDIVHFSPTSAAHVELKVKSGAPVSDLGWEIYPDGMYKLLKQLAKRYPSKPIVITENGIADHADTQRAAFLTSHLQAVLRAIGEGVKVEGYCHWSLLDNFEWDEGFTPRFGLYEMDYATQTRIPRPSAALFSKIAHANALPQ